LPKVSTIKTLLTPMHHVTLFRKDDVSRYAYVGYFMSNQTHAVRVVCCKLQQTSVYLSLC